MVHWLWLIAAFIAGEVVAICLGLWAGAFLAERSAELDRQERDLPQWLPPEPSRQQSSASTQPSWQERSRRAQILEALDED